MPLFRSLVHFVRFYCIWLYPGFTIFCFLPEPFYFYIPLTSSSLIWTFAFTFLKMTFGMGATVVHPQPNVVDPIGDGVELDKALMAGKRFSTIV